MPVFIKILIIANAVLIAASSLIALKNHDMAERVSLLEYDREKQIMLSEAPLSYSELSNDVVTKAKPNKPATATVNTHRPKSNFAFASIDQQAINEIDEQLSRNLARQSMTEIPTKLLPSNEDILFHEFLDSVEMHDK